MVAVPELAHPARDEIQLSSVLFALSDPDRREVVRQLLDGPLDAANCFASDPSMPKSTKSHLMKVLREAGIIRNEPHGRNRRLTLRRADLDSRFPGLIDAIFTAHEPPD
ncbi:ArsR/SmtB family transcription factor [Microbacterium gilvum]|uniref:Helix-turn-helix domain-containing protein n=1 Tax=Microbacterium gilvum TaxID=1336204 RepID=A0ABP8ZVS3_9MICO